MTVDSSALVVDAVGSVSTMLRELDETFWARAIASVGWTCRDTIEHIGGDFLHYAGQVARQPVDHYVAFSFDQSRARSHVELVETVEMAGLLLAAAVAFAPDESTAWHPQGMFSPAGLAPRGRWGALVHGHDIAATAGLDWKPDDELCRVVTDTFFPQTPVALRRAHSPADVLLWATGRTALDGFGSVSSWDYRAAAQDSR